ncbi:BRCA1-associated RING domain protein 1-like isoform X2 [Biomphalaria glabrata]|uniref:BRCA1-associated RING domain protein 1-like isoform X2 n=1 Tax=Biomphalaria glabrata TaxID=6526 RepID=A0A9W2ZWR2_BIOGL|nr:BRCA1-associated RING domain protein 1-like isoform X2 [Biomphalaria glabrata]
MSEFIMMGTMSAQSQVLPQFPLDNVKFSRTISALDSLRNFIQCCKCSESSTELFSLGQCEHRFCRNCAESNGGNPCPVCDMPAYATLAHIDKQLSSISQLCFQMSNILEGLPLLSEEKKDNHLTLGDVQCMNTMQALNPSHADKCNNIELISSNNNKTSVHKSTLNNPTKEVKETKLVKKRGKHIKDGLTSCQTKKLSPQAAASSYNKLSSSFVGKLDESTSEIDTSIDVTPNKSRNSGRRKSNLMKRNAKGETLLQVATIKANVETVKSLLEEGANPNVKDYAGWTPLHEAVNHGNSAIARLLIQHGASVNAPGLNNDTPLHDAVSNYHRDCIQLLVSAGANIWARNLQGQTPVDLAQSDELKQILLTSSSTISEKQSVHNASLVKETQKLCFTGTALSKDKQKLLEVVANFFNVKFVDNFTAEVTHLITGVNGEGRCPRTLKYLTAILGGKWVLKSEWLSSCLESQTFVAEDDFEIPGCSTHPDSKSAQKGRLNKYQQLPGLFDGCQFYFLGKFSHPSREELIGLVKLGGGAILTREPRLHNLDDYPYTIPYHAVETSTLADCSIFVLFDDSCPNPPYVEAQRMSYLPVSWLLDSIATFNLMDKTNYVKK